MFSGESAAMSILGGVEDCWVGRAVDPVAILFARIAAVRNEHSMAVSVL